MAAMRQSLLSLRWPPDDQQGVQRMRPQQQHTAVKLELVTRSPQS